MHQAKHRYNSQRLLKIVRFLGKRKLLKCIGVINGRTDTCNYFKHLPNCGSFVGFILFIASVAWIAFKANILHADLLWYEVLVIGIIASAIWIGVGLTNTSDQPNTYLFIGLIVFGPLVAITTYFIIYPFHLNIFISAIITFISSLLFTFVYIVVIDTIQNTILIF